MPPGSQMHFINSHRLVAMPLFQAALHPIGVAPLKAGIIINNRSVFRSQLRGQGKGIGFQQNVSLLSSDGELINIASF